MKIKRKKRGEKKISKNPSTHKKERRRISESYDYKRKIPPFSSVFFEVETVSVDSLLNKLSAVTVASAPMYTSGKLLFSVPSKDCDKIIALLEDLCYNYKIKWIKGVFARVFSVLRRTGIIVGTAICIAVMVVYSFFVVEIDGEGLSADVSAVLSSHGISKGKLLFSFDEEGLTRELSALDGVAFASIERVGTRVRVRVRYEQDETPFFADGGEVVSKADSVVTRIIVFGGTAEVEVGDSVKAGDSLIGGYYLHGEDKIPTTASGEVYGQTTVTKTRFFADTYLESAKGREKKFSRLGFFGSQPNAPKSPYENYEVSFSRTKNDNLIPYVIYEWTYREIITTEKSNSLTEDEMKDAVYSSLVEELSGRILSREDKAERTDGGYLVTSTVVTEGRIDK